MTVGADDLRTGDQAGAGPVLEPANPDDAAAEDAGFDDAESEDAGSEDAGSEDAAGKVSPEQPETDADAAAAPAAERGRVRRVAARVTTGLAGLLVLLALLAPNQVSQISPAAFLRIPVEALFAVALLIVLPGKAKRWAAAVVGVVLGVLAIMKLVDLGFYTVLDRRFDPVFDWGLLKAGLGFVAGSFGQAGAIIAVVAAAALAIGVLVLMPLSVMRLSRLVVRHSTAAAGTATTLGVAWIICAVLGAQIVSGVPVAARSYDPLLQVGTSLQDHQAFLTEVAVDDTFGDTPGSQLLTGLRGKDVVIAFVESYGRDAAEEEEFAGVGRLLDAGTRRLDAAGFASRSAFLTSPTVGGSSWLAHSTLLSGLWIKNQQRYLTLVDSERMTLNRAFQKAGWQTVGVMPGVTQEWPEAEYFGYDQVYDAHRLGYRGERNRWAAIPDQYTMSAFEQLVRSRSDRDPVMAEIPLISSHAPWTEIPPLIGWDQVRDGKIYDNVIEPGDSPEEVLGDRTKARTEYGKALEYTLGTLISYVEHYGDEDLVFIFLGDHQPSPLITDEDASRDVPITIVTRDQAVLDQISGWGWEAGLRPSPDAPVWWMDEFRDKFLTAYSPQAD